MVASPMPASFPPRSPRNARCPAQQRVDVACCHCGPGNSRGEVSTAQLCALLFGAAARQHQFGVWGVRKTHTVPAGEQLVGEDPSMCLHCGLPAACPCRHAGDDRVVQKGQTVRSWSVLR